MKKLLTICTIVVLCLSTFPVIVSAAKEVILTSGLIAVVAGDPLDYNEANPDKSSVRLTDGNATDSSQIYLWKKVDDASYTIYQQVPISGTQFIYDFGKTCTLTAYSLTPRYQGYAYSVEYSMDKSKWDKACEVASANWKDEKSFTPKLQARYVRFVFTKAVATTKNEYMIQLKELEVSGYAATSVEEPTVTKSVVSSATQSNIIMSSVSKNYSETSSVITGSIAVSSTVSSETSIGTLDNSTSEITKNNKDDGGFPLWAMILIAAGAVLIVGGVFIYLMFMKKK